MTVNVTTPFTNGALDGHVLFSPWMLLLRLDFEGGFETLGTIVLLNKIFILQLL